MATQPPVSQTTKPSLEHEVLEVYKIPQCLTEGLTAGFVSDVVDVNSTSEEWLVLEDRVKLSKVTQVLEKLESEGKLRSNMTQPKFRHYDDDIEPPKLNKRIRVYSLVR